VIRALVLVPFLAGVWWLLSGYFVPLLLMFGALSVVISILLARRLGVVDPEGVPYEILGRLIPYLPWLIKEIVLANIDVIKRIVNPKLPISPTLVEVPATQKSRLGEVLFANSITLTPGTVSIRVRDDVILVHSIAKEGADALLKGDMDRRVTKVEGSFDFNPVRHPETA